MRTRRDQMAAEATTYEGAVERLEEIIRRLDSNQAGLRRTLEPGQEGKGLIEVAAGGVRARRAGARRGRQGRSGAAARRADHAPRSRSGLTSAAPKTGVSGPFLETLF